MKKKWIMSWLVVFALSGCQLTPDVNLAEEGENVVIVEWADHQRVASSKEYAKVYLYDSEIAWSTPHATPVASASLADKRPPSGGTITPVSSAMFKNLPAKKYWVKIITAYNHERLIEHNQYLPHVLDSPLHKGTTTTAKVHTKRHLLQEYRLQSLTVNALPEITANPGKRVKVVFKKFYPSGYAGPAPTTYYEASVPATSFPLQIKDLDVSIREFNSWWSDPYYYLYLTVEDATSPVYRSAEINLFKLINENAGVYDRLMHKRDDGTLVYTIAGEWALQE